LRGKTETISTCHAAERKATLSVEVLIIFVNFFGGALYGEDGCKETLYANGAQAVFSEAAEVNRITVKEVCALAQLNRATFYAHYSDCFALMESIENELIDAFEKSLRYVNSFDVTALIEAIYDMVDQNQTACRVLILGNTNSTVLMRMIALAKEDSIAYWRKELPNASETDLEMMYTHLSNGLMHVVVEGYDKYSKDEIIRFVSRVVKASLSLFRSPQRPLA
jgi:AcrR family transcriptional regulator